MARDQWTDKLSLGNETIDREHRRLFDLLGWLEEELYAEHDLALAQVKSVVDELGRHAEEHFRHEEEMMDSLSSMPEPVRAAHRQDHRHWRLRLLENLAPLMRAATDLERRAYLARILLVGKSFWTEHFVTFDRALAEYLPRPR